MNLKYLFLILLGGSCVAQEAPPCSPMLDYIHEHLSCRGTLKQSDGFVYVDVDDRYIHDLIPFIEPQGFEEPPYFGRPDLVGAHITVVYPSEMEEYQIERIEECGMTVSFTPRSCHIIHPPHWPEGKAVYFIAVDVPELENFRKKYGLPKPEYDFHITIGFSCSHSGSASQE